MLRLPHSRSMGDGIFELRPRGRSGIGRAFYCFLIEKRIVIVHAFIKKSQQTPDKDLKVSKKTRQRGKKMDDLKYSPVKHDHEKFLKQAYRKKGFKEAYEALELEYQLADQMLNARSRAGLTQDVVAARMGTTKSAVSRLEGVGKHTPSLATLKRYAEAVGCDLSVKLVPQK